MSSAILPASLSIPRPTNRSFSSLRVLTGSDQLQFPLRPLSIDLAGATRRFPCPPVRMGGGPRTYPGGVSKWQWKRMQAKKAKQLLQARLLRERQIYEMRKRAELKAAVSELERPWEVVERAPVLFSRSADEQVKALADRFQRPGGFDMWSERDGPQVFRAPDGLPSARFFPKGVVHSVKPYGIIARNEELPGGEDGPEDGKDLRFDDWISRGGGGTRRRLRRSSNRSAVDFEGKDSVEGGNHEFSRDTNLGSQNARFLRNPRREELGGMGGRRVSRGGGPSNGIVVDVEAKVSIGGGDDHLRNRNARFSRNSSREELNRTEGRRVSRQQTVVDVDIEDSIEGNNHQFSRDGHLGRRNSRPSRNSSREELGRTDGRRVSGGRAPMHSYQGRDANLPSYGGSRDRSGNRRMHGLEVANGKDESNKGVARGGYGSRNSRFKAGKILLRPTTDLYSEGDGSGTRDLKWSGGSSSRANHERRRY